MSKLLNFASDQQGTSAYAPLFPDDAKSVSLAVGNNQSFTVPSTYNNWVLGLVYSSNPEVWVSVGNTAAPPAGATWADTTSILNIAQLQVRAGDEVSFYNNGASSVRIGAVLYGIS
jgi:hypothetical protein